MDQSWRPKPAIALLSHFLGILVVVASAGGLFVERIYALEKPIWAAQAVGQDIINLFVAVPVLVGSAHFAARGSLTATLVWVGLLIYLAYSYTLYTFFVHFGPLFPVYVAVLALSFYLLLGTLLSGEIGRGDPSPYGKDACPSHQ